MCSASRSRNRCAYWLLTLIVPVLALILGVEIPANALAGAVEMPWLVFCALLVGSCVLGPGVFAVQTVGSAPFGGDGRVGCRPWRGLGPWRVKPVPGHDWVHRPWDAHWDTLCRDHVAGVTQTAGAGLTTTVIASAVTVAVALPLAGVL